MSAEPFTISAGTGAAAAPFAGGRRRSHKKLRLVKKKTVRKMLAKAGLKMRGGAEPPAPAAEPAADVAGGRRRHRKSHRKSHRRSRRSMFGF
jgi:hypothetical protein